MITEDTNFNIPQDQRDRLNALGGKIAYDKANVTPGEIFDIVAKAWYLGESQGRQGIHRTSAFKIPQEVKVNLLHLTNHANPDGFLSYEDKIYLEQGYKVQYFKFSDLPEDNSLRLKRLISRKKEIINYLCSMESREGYLGMGESYKVNLICEISLESLPNIINSLVNKPKIYKTTT